MNNTLIKLPPLLRQESSAAPSGELPALSRGLQFRGILGAEEFQVALLKERVRSDRTGHQFSLVLIELAKLTVGGAAPADPVATLRGRLRIIDELGWFDASRIGVILPGTDLAGAQIVTEVISKVLDVIDAPESAFTAHVYPEFTSTSRDHDQGNHQNGSSSNGTNGTGTNGMSRDRASAPALGTAGSPQPTGAGRLTSKVSLKALEAGTSTGFYGDIETAFVRDLPVWKRTLDIVGSASLLLLLAPVMLVSAIAVKLSSPGPIIFRQRRAGRGGHAFNMYKFRSMFVDAEERRTALLERNEQTGPIFKMKHDPRMTSIGRILRSTSIDELPQFWNVLCGDMTLVGPRPPTFNEIQKYEPWQRRRLEVTPGITCLWQVLGRSTIPFVTWVRLDVRYIMNRSFWGDVGLLLKTIPAVLSRRGAH